jgi:outer membrane protein
MKYIIMISCFAICNTTYAQDVLQAYINEGLENNLALAQKETSYEKSLEALKEAKSLFYPAISLNARYTRSEGGRVIEFPVGDMLNPVYSTLNALTSSNLFPMLANEEIKFLRTREHETKLRLIQPVLNTDIYYNSKIKKGLSVSEEISLDQYKRELTAEIKKAYYTVGMTGSIMTLLQETRLLLLENIRVNEKLVENNKITPDNIYRSRTELSILNQKILESEKNRKVSVAYFNFLLNRPLNDSVIVEVPADFPLPEEVLTNYTEQAMNRREEIKNLENYQYLSDLMIRMNRTAALPDMNIVADYGFQGEKYEFNKNQDYMQASLVMTWDLFTGFQRKAKVEQAILQKEILDNQLDEAKSRIELQVISSFSELKASEAAETAAGDQVVTAREGFRLVKRKFEEGQASLIEFMDARHTMTQAEENLIISRFNHLANYAEFEKVIANTKF